ncbi:hypothetical protein OTK49_01265 [Vibrio coralliirubri]|uniref:hypothetical protein n=1 Tax=Vibrio coralliirubri TaxID=1516159 RepID=UPI0022853617|nr:hypothetical protein [Vibrio coralliirubri]MCY9861158.1 hypothetical protein [Vibrio coralliirubri]
MSDKPLSLFERLRIKLGIRIINVAAKVLPDGYDDIHFVKNCTHTNIIKLKNAK